MSNDDPDDPKRYLSLVPRKTETSQAFAAMQEKDRLEGIAKEMRLRKLRVIDMTLNGLPERCDK